MKEWSFKKAIRIQTYSSYHPIPVPFNIISNLILGLLWLWRVCSRGRTVSPTISLLNFAVASRIHLSMCARVKLATGLHYLPCKRSAGDNSPTRLNFPPSYVTRNCPILKTFFERYYPISELNYKHLKTKKVFSVYNDNFPPFLEFNVFSINKTSRLFSQREFIIL